MKKLNIINSASSISTWHRCPKLWKYKYIDRYEPIDSGSFEMSYGSYFHSLVEEKPKTSFGKKWRSVVETHFRAYTAYYKTVPEHELKYSEKEQRFRIELAPGYKYHGYIDGIGTYNNQVVAIETKTTGSKLPDFFERMENSLQPRLYVAALRHQGYNIDGYVLDVTRRPGIRQKKTETDEAYIQRVADWYYDNAEDAFGRRFVPVSSLEADELLGEVMMLTDLQRTGLFPKNRNSCYDFRRQCEFHPVCFKSEKLTNTDKFKERVRK